MRVSTASLHSLTICCILAACHTSSSPATGSVEIVGHTSEALLPDLTGVTLTIDGPDLPGVRG